MYKYEVVEGQAEDSFCGPASLAWAAKEQGVNISQYELAKIMETTYEDGTSHGAMVEGAHAIGLMVMVVNGADLKDLQHMRDKGFSVIVNWMSGPKDLEDGHYSNFIEYKGGVVSLNDCSEGGMIRGMTGEEFNGRWYDIDEGVRARKWALVVYRMPQAQIDGVL